MSKTYIEKYQPNARAYLEPGQMFHNRPQGRLASEMTDNGEARLVASSDFDYDAVDRELFGVESSEDTVNFSDMSAAFGLILEFIVGKHKQSLVPKSIAGRAMSLLYLLNPSHLEELALGSLELIAQHCGCTKQAISASLMAFRDQSGVKLCLSKLASTRESFRTAAIRTIKDGTHSRYHRKDSTSHPEVSMEAVGE